MEDHNIGKHCQYPHCALKDYLNFYCKVCDKNLCKDHYHHEVSCPFTTEIKNSTKCNIVDNFSNFSNLKSKPNTNLFCSYSKCGQPIHNSIGYECRLCSLVFCMSHRIECDHECKNKKVSFKDKYLENKNKFKERLEQLKNKK